MKIRIKKKPMTQAKNGVNVGLDNYFQGKMQKDPGINQFGEEDLNVNRTLSSVPREEANLEAEGGEFVIVPGAGGIPETYSISGPRHAQGGVPMKLKPGSFIWSDHKKGMKIKDKEILAEFGMSVGKKNKKGFTPADIAKKYDINPYLKVLFDPYSDDMDRESAEDMIKKYIMQLGKLGLVQESMKGFPQGVPDIAKPYMQKLGMDEQMFAQQGAEQQEQPQMRYGGNVNGKQAKRFPGLSIAQDGKGVTYNLTTANPEMMNEQSPYYATPDDFSSMLDAIRGWRYSGDPNAPATPEQIEAMKNIYPIHREGEDVLYEMMPEGVSPDVSSYNQEGGSFEPHQMIDPKTGQSEDVYTYEDHMRLQSMGYEHPDKEMPEPVMAHGGMKKYKVYKRGGDVSAFNDGYGSVNFGNAALGKFIPTYQNAGEIPKGPIELMYEDFKYIPPRIQKQIDKERAQYKKQLAKDKKQLDKKTLAGYKGQTELEYEKFLIDNNFKKRDYRYDEWLQNQAMADPDNPIYKEVYKSRKGSFPQRVTRAADFAENVGDVVTDKVTDLKNYVTGEEDETAKKDGKRIDFQGMTFGPEGGTRTVTEQAFTDGNLTDEENRARYEELKRQGVDVGEFYPGIAYAKPDISKVKPKSSKVVKKQNVPADKIASSKEGTKNPDTPYYKGANGVIYKVAWDKKEVGQSEYKGDELKTVFGGNQTIANKYQYLKDTFETDKDMQKKLADYIRNSAKNKDNYLAKGQKSGDALTGKREEYYTNYSQKVDGMSDEELVKGFIDSQHRNLALAAHGINPNDFEQDGTIIPGSATAKKYPDVKDIYGGYKKAGVEVTDLKSGNSSTIAFEQLGYHGYVDLLKDKDNLPDAEKEKLKYFTERTGVGVGDESGVGKEDSRVSAIDGYGTNTTAGHVSWTEGEPEWTGTDTEAEWTEEKPDPERQPVKPYFRRPARWWAQDIGNIGNLFGQWAGLKKYLPIDLGVDLKKPDVLYYDPSRALAANAEQAYMANMFNQGFGDSRMASFRGSDITGKALENAANVLAQYEGKNVPIGNQYLQQVADIANKQRMLNMQNRGELHKGWTIANQQYDNSKRLAMRNLFEGWRQGLTNKWKTDTLNQLYPQFAVAPEVGGRMDFTGGRPQINTGQPGSVTSDPYIASLEAQGITPTEEDYREAAKLNAQGQYKTGQPYMGGSPYAGGNQFFQQYSGITSPFYMPGPGAGNNPYGQV